MAKKIGGSSLDAECELFTRLVGMARSETRCFGKRSEYAKVSAFLNGKAIAHSESMVQRFIYASLFYRHAVVLSHRHGLKIPG